MTFGEKVVYVRAKMMLTQSQLANKLGISLSTIARWETQERKPQMALYGRFLAFCEDNKISFDENVNGGAI